MPPAKYVACVQGIRRAVHFSGSLNLSACLNTSCTQSAACVSHPRLSPFTPLNSSEFHPSFSPGFTLLSGDATEKNFGRSHIRPSVHIRERKQISRPTSCAARLGRTLFSKKHGPWVKPNSVLPRSRKSHRLMAQLPCVPRAACSVNPSVKSSIPP